MMHTIKPTSYNYLFSADLKPIAAVNPGDTVEIYTEDAYAGQLHSEKDLVSEACATTQFFNPQTGPIYINGAEPGDTLVVDFKSIEFTRPYAVTAIIKYFGGLQSTNATRMLQDSLPEKTWVWELTDDDKAIYNKALDIKLPVESFCGTMATAPKLESITAVAPGYFGGNMDVPDVCPGNRIYLPVNNEGALFYIGDCHARQGQGEVTGAALEIPAKCTLSFELIKGKAIEWPRVESSDKIMVIGSARPMEDAARIAYGSLVDWMVEDYGFDKLDAYMLIGQAGGLYVGTMVDSLYSLCASIEKKYLIHR